MPQFSWFGSREYIDDYFLKVLYPCRPKSFSVFSKQLPSYRFVDLFEAAESVSGSWAQRDRLQSQHANLNLRPLLDGHNYDRPHLTVNRSPQSAWPIGPGEERFLPVDAFWTSTGRDIREKVVVRLSENTFMSTSTLEVASNNPALAEACLKEILERSDTQSIYRSQILRISFESGTRDEYGDVEKQESLRISFLSDESVTSDDLIIDKRTTQILKRNVVDLFNRRDVLKANGVPVKRGILLYGPPGTGKTFTCRYLCNQVEDVTRVFVTGAALTQIGAIFSVARMLQPCLLFLEDVDLAFSSREINLYNSGLADLLDHLDGIQPDDEICVVMTTNSIERMESAIKDRPGRVSQCVFMDAPTPMLRKRYLQRYLRDFDASQLDLDELVETSDGVSQAFLKEWIFRAAQMATEDMDEDQHGAVLSNIDFRNAMKEMKSFIGGVGAKIVGFTAR